MHHLVLAFMCDSQRGMRHVFDSKKRPTSYFPGPVTSANGSQLAMCLNFLRPLIKMLYEFKC